MCVCEKAKVVFFKKEPQYKNHDSFSPLDYLLTQTTEYNTNASVASSQPLSRQSLSIFGACRLVALQK